MPELLSEIALLVCDPDCPCDLPCDHCHQTACKILERLGAAARLEDGVWTGQWLDRIAAQNIETQPNTFS